MSEQQAPETCPQCSAGPAFIKSSDMRGYWFCGDCGHVWTDAQYFEEEDVLGVANRIRALLALVDEQAHEIADLNTLQAQNQCQAMGARMVAQQMQERLGMAQVELAASRASLAALLEKIDDTDYIDAGALIKAFIDEQERLRASLRAQEPRIEQLQALIDKWRALTALNREQQDHAVQEGAWRLSENLGHRIEIREDCADDLAEVLRLSGGRKEEK